MRDHNMARRKRHRNGLDHPHQRIVVRDEDLKVMARLRQFGRGTDKVGHWSRGAVPNEDRQSLTPQMVGNPTANNAKANNPNAFSNSTRHALWKLRLNLSPRNSIHLTTNRVRCANSDSKAATTLRRFSAAMRAEISGVGSSRIRCRVGWTLIA